MSESQPLLNLVSKLELSDCPEGACAGIVSNAGYTPPLTVLFGHLPGQIVLSEPLLILSFLTAPLAADKMSLVQITSPFSGLGGFLYDAFDMVMVLAHFHRNLRTISYPNSRKVALPPY